MTLTPEDLAKIEAHEKRKPEWYYDDLIRACNHIPVLIAALKEAWAENERFKFLLSRERAEAWQALAEHHDTEADRHRQKAQEAYANVESYKRSQMPEELEKT